MTTRPHYYAANLAYLADLPHAVYVIWRDDEPLYVGMTSNWINRTSQHKTYFDAPYNATHLDVWHVAESRWEAEQIETATIRDLDPLHNSQNSPRVERRRATWATEDARIIAARIHPDEDALDALWASMARAIEDAA